MIKYSERNYVLILISDEASHDQSHFFCSKPETQELVQMTCALTKIFTILVQYCVFWCGVVWCAGSGVVLCIVVWRHLVWF